MSPLSVSKSAVLLGLLLLLACPPAHAGYLDPGTGSYLLQLAIGGLLGALFTAKMYWAKLKSYFTRGDKKQLPGA
jgi:hypothetical protein